MPTSLSSTRPSTPLSTLSTTAIKDGHRGRPYHHLRLDSFTSTVSNPSTSAYNTPTFEQERELGGYEDDVEDLTPSESNVEHKKSHRKGAARKKDEEGGIENISTLPTKGGDAKRHHASHEEEEALERTRLRLLGGLEPRAQNGAGSGGETPITEEAKEEIKAARGFDAVVAEGHEAGMVDTSGEKV